MIFAVDAVGAKFGGAATVLLDLIMATLRSPVVDRVVVFCSPAPLRQFALPHDPRLVAVESRLGESVPVGRAVWHEAGLNHAARSFDSDVVLCLGGGGRVRAAACVNLIQQPLPFQPEVLRTLPPLSRVRMTALRWTMRRSCRRAALVVVQTATMREAVSTTLGVDPSRIAVVEPDPPKVKPTSGAPQLDRMRRSPSSARLLYVGSDAPHKNLHRLKSGLDLLRRSRGDALLFATVGSGHPLARQPGVVPLGYLTPPVLAEAYGLATALVMPSLAETVGLPMLEAAAAGTPVLAADLPYAHDVCGDAALFFDPLRPESIADAAACLLGDPKLRASLAERGRRLVARRSAARPYDTIVALAHRASLRS